MKKRVSIKKTFAHRYFSQKRQNVFINSDISLKCTVCKLIVHILNIKHQQKLIFLLIDPLARKKPAGLGKQTSFAKKMYPSPLQKHMNMPRSPIFLDYQSHAQYVIPFLSKLLRLSQIINILIFKIFEGFLLYILPHQPPRLHKNTQSLIYKLKHLKYFFLFSFLLCQFLYDGEGDNHGICIDIQERFTHQISDPFESNCLSSSFDHPLVPSKQAFLLPIQENFLTDRSKRLAQTLKLRNFNRNDQLHQNPQIFLCPFRMYFAPLFQWQQFLIFPYLHRLTSYPDLNTPMMLTMSLIKASSSLFLHFFIFCMSQVKLISSKKWQIYRTISYQQIIKLEKMKILRPSMLVKVDSGYKNQ